MLSTGWTVPTYASSPPQAVKCPVPVLPGHPTASAELVRAWPCSLRNVVHMWYLAFFFTSRMPFLTQNPPLSSRLGTGTHFRWIAVHEAEKCAHVNVRKQLSGSGIKPTHPYRFRKTTGHYHLLSLVHLRNRCLTSGSEFAGTTTEVP